MRTVPADRKSRAAIDAVMSSPADEKTWCSRSHCVLPSDKELLEFVAVGVGVVSDDLQNLGDESRSGSPFDVDEQVERVGDVAFDRSIRQFDIALQDATGEAVDGLQSGVGMNRRERS